MKQSYSFSLILVPLILLLVLASGLFVQRAGIKYNVDSNNDVLRILPQPVNLIVSDYFTDKPSEALVVYDSEDQSTDGRHRREAIHYRATQANESR